GPAGRRWATPPPAPPYLPPELVALLPRQRGQISVPRLREREDRTPPLHRDGDLDAVLGRQPGNTRDGRRRGGHRVQIPHRGPAGAGRQQRPPDLFLATGLRQPIEIVGDVGPPDQLD